MLLVYLMNVINTPHIVNDKELQQQLQNNNK